MNFKSIAACLAVCIVLPLKGFGQQATLESISVETTLTYVKAPVTYVKDKGSGDGKRIGLLKQYEKAKVIGKPKNRYCMIVWEGGKGYVYYKHLDLGRLSKKNKPKAPEKRPREYFTGPRGGCYYITPAGNKQYVPRENCR